MLEFALHKMKEKKLDRIRERADEMKDESSETEEWIEFR